MINPSLYTALIEIPSYLSKIYSVDLNFSASVFIKTKLNLYYDTCVDWDAFCMN